MSRRRRAGQCGAALVVLAVVVLIGLITKDIWWAVIAAVVLAVVWLSVAFTRTSRDLDAELGRSNARVVAAERKKHARISSGESPHRRCGDTSHNGPQSSEGPAAGTE